MLARENLQDDSNPLISEYKKDSWIGIDKVQHFMYSLSVSFGAQYILVNKFNLVEKKAVPLSSSLSFIAGYSKELLDKKSSKNFFSKKDMVVNSLGILFATLIILED
tara:strand:- start:4507 stop:4827 length:321 start_codon:yes stop_codon:yes gene_type:complete